MAKKYLKDFYWKDYLNITIGLVIYAFGLLGFIKPVGIVVGGLAGISLLVDYSTKGGIPLQETFFAVNCVLIIIASKILGIKFMVKTIYGVVMLTALFSIIPLFIDGPIITGEPIMSGVIGAMLCGSGLGIVFSASGSAGGTDIVVAIINKYKNISFGKGTLLCDFVIISLSYLVFKDVNIVIYGLIVMGVMTYTIDMVMNSSKESVQIFIISRKHDLIADAINKEMKRGCTVLDGMGWYTKEPLKVVMVVVSQSQANQVTRLATSVDEKAFVTQSSVKSVYGEGFDKMMHKQKKK